MDNMVKQSLEDVLLQGNSTFSKTAEGNFTREAGRDVKKEMELDSQSAGRVPKEENNSKALKSVFLTDWLKLSGPASKCLVKAFSGSAFVVLPDNNGSWRETEELPDIIPMPKGKEADGGVAEVPGIREGTTSKEPPARIVITRTPAAGRHIKVLKTCRIVLLGETKVGKSSLANAMFEEDVFKVEHSPICGTSECQAKSKSVDGRRITLIETPDFFGKDRPEEELRREVGRFITESAPGPHVFFIVLKVEKSPDHWKDVIQRIAQYLPEAFNYAAVVFTHGDQLPEGMKIEEFVEQNECLSDLVKKCGGRCHVVDNKYWKTNQRGDYRNNKVTELLHTADRIQMENKGGCYNMQQAGGKRQADGGAPRGDPSKSNTNASKGTWVKLTGPAAKSLAGLFGPAVVVLQETEGGDDEEEGEDLEEDKNKVKKEEKDEEEENEEEEDEGEEEQGEKKTEDKDEKDKTEKEKNAEDKKGREQEKGKEPERKAGQGGAGGDGGLTVIGSLLGLCLGILAGVWAGLGASLAAVVGSVAAGVGAAGGGAGLGGAGPGTSAGSGSGAGGGAAAASFTAALSLGVLGVVAFIAHQIDQFIEFLKTLPRLIEIILLVVVFYFMLLFSFGVLFPSFGTLLLIIGVLLMFAGLVLLLVLL